MTNDKRWRWSWQVGLLFGISIRVHITLFALLVWVAIAAPVHGAGVWQTLAQAGLVASVFGCVLVHELAHALVARRFGCPTREILLLPIGGIAQLERIPQRPAQELLVAVVGPATNVAIAAVLGAVILLAGWPIGPEQPHGFAGIVVSLFWINASLAAFNLLPAFPMDGGRVLRAILASRIGRARATRAAGIVGKVLAAVFVMIGFTVGGTMLAVIGMFVWFASSQESSVVMLTSILSRATVADAMVRQPHVIHAAVPVDDVAEQMIATGQRELAVVEDGRIRGVVTAADIARRATRGTVGAAMRDVPVVTPAAPLDQVLEPLGRHGAVLVADHGTIVGLLTEDQLSTYVALHRP